MASIYPRQAGHAKPIFNHPIHHPSTHYYYDQPQQHSQSRSAYPDMDNFSRSVCIDPQHLMVASPLSPNQVADYGFPIAQYPMFSSSHLDEEDAMDYSTAGSRKRPAQVQWSQISNQKASNFERNSNHRSSGLVNPYYQSSTLPTPPSSPTHTIPASSAVSQSQAIAISPPTGTGSSGPRHYCNHPSCLDLATGRPTKSFSRRADLQRHNSTTHDTLTPTFSCPRPNCSRKGEAGFTRQDHLIEHRRGYHGEDIPKRGQKGSRSGSASSDRKR